LLLGLFWWGAAKIIAMTLEKVFPTNPFYDLLNLQLEVEEKPQTIGVEAENQQTWPLTPNPASHKDFPISIHIQQDQPLEFKFKWDQKGLNVPNLNLIFSNYRLEVLFEKIGRDVPSGDRTVVNVVPVANTNKVAAMVTVPANYLPVGLYKVVVLFRLDDLAVPANCFMAAFKEVGMINVFRQIS
jgi:hypothetical protein